MCCAQSWCPHSNSLCAAPSPQHPLVILGLSKPGGGGVHQLNLFCIMGPVTDGMYCCGEEVTNGGWACGGSIRFAWFVQHKLRIVAHHYHNSVVFVLYCSSFGA